VIRHLTIDDATMRALERHESHAHAIPGRAVLDLGDSVVLHDPRDPDVFWNRMVSVRWPGDRAGFDRRLTSALALFAALGRTPHVWPSPSWSQPADLVDRLVDHGFHDVGGGHLMLLEDAALCPPVAAAELDRGVTLHTIRTGADAAPSDCHDMGLVLAQAFEAPPGRAAELAADLRITLDDERVTLALARVRGEPAAVAKATSFDGYTYLSSVGTREVFRGRGLAGLVTRQALAGAGGAVAGRAYLGVFSGNAPALRVYARLGFASLGESPDLVLR
jgi:ribosomal protein S18 acetylase RimI-like enzyme